VRWAYHRIDLRIGHTSRTDPIVETVEGRLVALETSRREHGGH